MFFSRLQGFPGNIYDFFIHDGRRLYRLLPDRLRRRFWVVFCTQFLAALVETCTLLVITLFAVSVASPSTVLNNVFVKALFGLMPSLQAFCAEHRHMVIFTSLFMTLFILFKTILSTLVARQITELSEDVSLYIGKETLRRYLNKGYLWHLSPAGPAVVHRFYGRESLAQFLMGLLLVSSHFLCCLTLFISLFVAEPGLASVVVAIFSLGSLGTYMFLRRRLDAAGLRNHNLNVAESMDRLTLTQGLREVLIYRRQDVMFEKMTSRMAEGKPVRAFLAFAGYMPPQILEFLGFSTISCLTAALLLWGMDMAAIVAAASMLMLTAWRVLPAVNRTLNYTISIRNVRPAALDCLELLETFIAEEPEPLPDPDPDFHFRRDLVLENVTFTYPGSKENALNGVSLKLEKGQSVGLIGPSGAGKSTLALILTGLVSPEDGRFLVDGRELSPPALAAYVRLVGFVPQNPLLLPGTVADNVAFSRWGEGYDRRMVEMACRQAALDIGLDRTLGGGSHGISGGQAQRVAIARTLFAHPDIIIFDEATSALDQACENIITETIKKLPQATTSIVIAHRLTTVEHCDALVWLEQGRVRDIGTPTDLLPRYRASLTEIEEAMCNTGSVPG